MRAFVQVHNKNINKLRNTILNLSFICNLHKEYGMPLIPTNKYFFKVNYFNQNNVEREIIYYNCLHHCAVLIQGRIESRERNKRDITQDLSCLGFHLWIQDCLTACWDSPWSTYGTCCHCRIEELDGTVCVCVCLSNCLSVSIWSPFLSHHEREVT